MSQAPWNLPTLPAGQSNPWEALWANLTAGFRQQLADLSTPDPPSASFATGSGASTGQPTPPGPAPPAGASNSSANLAGNGTSAGAPSASTAPGWETGGSTPWVGIVIAILAAAGTSRRAMPVFRTAATTAQELHESYRCEWPCLLRLLRSSFTGSSFAFIHLCSRLLLHGNGACANAAALLSIPSPAAGNWQAAPGDCARACGR